MLCIKLFPFALLMAFVLLQKRKFVFADETEMVDAQPRIIGGIISSIREENYLVQVISDTELCGGSLVTLSWVITAAHCVKGVNPNEFRVFGGASELRGPYGIMRRVDFAAVNPQFNFDTLNMDVAALRLQRPMIGNNIGTIALATSLPPPRTNAKVSGWGVLDEDNDNPARRVHSVIVPVWSQGVCKKIYRGVMRITRSMFCAAKQNQKDSCAGDSGGPLVFRGELAGIVSWGNGCGTAYPGVYTSVPVIRNWFLNVMRNNR